MNYKEIIKHLSATLSPKRFRHSTGVSDTAVILAKCFGADEEKARIAGLIHDCARELPAVDLLSKAQEFGIVVDGVEKYAPILLHAPVAASLARVWYGIIDEEICRAIALHTTAGPNMTLLDKIIYLADVIEPGRSFSGVDTLRKWARKDLDKALLLSLEQSISYILKNGELIHPLTIDARNQLLIKKIQRKEVL